MRPINSEFEFVNDYKFVKPTITYVEEFCKSFYIAKGDKEKIISSLEMALIYAIDNFFDETNSIIKLKLILEENSLRMIIKDKGIPIDIALLSENLTKPNNHEELSNAEGISLFTIKKIIDEMEFKNLGNEGREWHLIKNLSQKIKDNIICEDDTKTALINENKQIKYHIRPFIPKDAIGISKLAYFTYGYSFGNFIYYPEKIIKMEENGVMVSNVAVTDDEEIIGHIALEFTSDLKSIPEIGIAFTNPKYRGQKVFHNLFISLINKAREMGKKVFFRTP